MTRKVAGINPAMLRWAREKAGYTPQEAARKLDKDPDVILSWESGESAPTYVQLEDLAYRVFKRPIAIFFFPHPPTEADPKQAFRTLPDFDLDNLHPDTRLAIRQAEAMQLALQELNDGTNPSRTKIFADLGPTLSSNPAAVASDVRQYLGVDLKEQMAWQGLDIALKQWRDVIQDNGVFVFKRSFKQKEISGFSLWDEEFPVIYVNNSTSESRQIFSLFHELAHVLLHTNSVTKVDDKYITALKGESQQLEVFCNRFAADLLVPSDDLERRLVGRHPDDSTVSDLAETYNVSREVILRKLLDKGIVKKREYESRVKQWNLEYERKRSEETAGGGNYYATQATYLGSKFLSLAFQKYYQGHCTIEQLAEYFNVKAENVHGLEAFLPTAESR